MIRPERRDVEVTPAIGDVDAIRSPGYRVRCEFFGGSGGQPGGSVDCV
jgi:hypothetical protein